MKNNESLEKIISLEDIDYVHFWGTNDKVLEFVRILFPKLKLIVRGEMLKLVGAEEDIVFFEEKFKSMLFFYEKFGKIDEESIMQIMDNATEGLIEESSGDVLLHGRNGLLIKARTANQHKMVKACETNDLIFAVGPAGTGKTYTAVALAVRALKNKEIKRIVLTRPAVEAGENLGFLPGDLRGPLFATFVRCVARYDTSAKTAFVLGR